MLAEAMGFDCVWAVEHTALRQYAHMTAPETFLAYLAGRRPDSSWDTASCACRPR